MLNKRSKKGFTLVEVLAATIILALIATGVLGGLGFSQRMVRANSSKDAYAARVQEAADVIIACINDQRSIPILLRKWIMSGQCRQSFSSWKTAFNYCENASTVRGFTG